MLKKFKLSNSRLLFLLIGILLAISVTGVWAAWNSTVGSGQTLTSVLWNDVVAKLVELNSRLMTLEGTPSSCTINYASTQEIGTSATVITGNNTNRTLDCPTGYILTGMRGGGDSGGGGEIEFIYIRCSQLVCS